METEQLSRYRYKLPLALSFYGAVVTIIYVLIWREPLYFQVSYGTLVLVIVMRCVVLMRRDEFKGKIGYQAKSLLWASILIYGLGFLLWNIDNQFCPQLRFARRVTGKNFSALFQLHGKDIFALTAPSACVSFNTHLDLLIFLSLFSCFLLFFLFNFKKIRLVASAYRICDVYVHTIFYIYEIIITKAN